MLGPTWLSWPLASLMAISALCLAGRLALACEHGRTGGYDVDLTHLVTSVAMAAMLVITFGVHLATTLAVIIGVPTLWFILRALRALTSEGVIAFVQPAQQVLMGAAMLYMLVVAGRSAAATGSSTVASTATSSAASSGAAMAGMEMPAMAMGGQVTRDLGGSTSSVAVTSLVLVGVLCLVAAQHARQLRASVATRHDRPPHGGPDLRPRAGGLLLAPALSLGCQLAMSGTMIYMLVLTV